VAVLDENVLAKRRHLKYDIDRKGKKVVIPAQAIACLGRMHVTESEWPERGSRCARCFQIIAFRHPWQGIQTSEARSPEIEMYSEEVKIRHVARKKKKDDGML
jgi:hypothetical protein